MNAHQLTGRCSSHITWLSDTLGIHKDMVNAWTKLANAARQDGFSLKIASGFRDFDRQLSIWNRKFSGELATKNKHNEVVNFSSLSDEEKVTAILLYSALPGSSRHHWGCDIDVYADNLLSEGCKLQLEPWEYQEGGPFISLTSWLKNNSESFGFFFPYDKYRGGVAAEPWHLSFRPISHECMNHTDLACITEAIEQSNIAGKTVILKKLPDIMNQYIRNINMTTRHNKGE